MGDYPAWRRVNGAGRLKRNGVREVSDEMAQEFADKELEDQVVTTVNGKPAQTLYVSLICDLLDKANLREATQGRARSTYCFRRTYATLCFQERVDVYFLAEQMGTSVQMIEQHYGHVNTIKHADRVLQGWQDGNSRSLKWTLPELRHRRRTINPREVSTAGQADLSSKPSSGAVAEAGSGEFDTDDLFGYGLGFCRSSAGAFFAANFGLRPPLAAVVCSVYFLRGETCLRRAVIRKFFHLSGS